MMRDRCPVCGALLLPDEKVCPRCGAAVDADQAEGMPDSGSTVNVCMAAETAPDTEGVHTFGGSGRMGSTGGNLPVNEPMAGGYDPVTGEIPKTIEELKTYCAYHEMPLMRMRFFIGEDYKYPKAFGIYQDGDSFVVYKNKASGNRAVRYQGPDQAYAVRELYAKLLEECHARDIWPDGRPETGAEMNRGRRTGLDRGTLRLFAIAVAIFILVSLVFFAYEHVKHSHDGYYRMNDDGMYYRYGSDWYYSDGLTDWYLVSAMMDDAAYGDYYLGEDYDDGWGYYDFHDSAAWQEIQAESESHTTASDYSSWDSSSTDWDSDW